MANYYVNPLSGNDTTGTGTWALPWKSLKKATDTVTANNDIWVYSTADDVITIDTVYTVANGVRILGTSDPANDPPTSVHAAGTYTTVTGAATSGVDITINSTNVHCKALQFASGSGTANIAIGTSDAEQAINLDSCKLYMNSTVSGSVITFGANVNRRYKLKLTETHIEYIGSTTTHIALYASLHMQGGSISVTGAGTQPTGIIGAIGYKAGQCIFEGVDLSDMTGVVFNAQQYAFVGKLINCKLGSGAITTTLNAPGPNYYVYNSASSNIHYSYAHYTYEGNTVISTAIYANDGATYNGTNRHSWIVTGTNATRGNPYVSEWIPRYHSGASAITPYLEILRDGSTTPYTDIQVAGEFSYQGTSGFPIATFVCDYGGDASTGTSQDAGGGLSGWTGESGSAWSGKLVSPSITPAEIGHLSARVKVYGAHTVYVDPTIRGTV